MANVWENTIKVDADGNATVDGNLTVNGTTTTIDTVNLTVKDKIIELAHGTTGTPSGDAGVIIERGSSTNAAIIWDESADAWVACTTSATGGSSGDLTLTPTILAAGSLGIGTTSPSSILEIEGSSGDLIFEMDNNAANSANFQIQNGAGNNRVDIVTNALDGGNPASLVNTTITMKAQKIGLLQTNPQKTLDVTGDGQFSTDLTVGGDVDVDGTLEADAITVEGTNLTAIYSPIAGSSSITTTGTVGTGTWQGTAVASAYLDADTAHLSGAQTFTGTKTLNSFKGTGGATVTNILDEDAMGSNSATALATQQSIKAYADTKGALAGSSSITTVGTVGTGTWQGTAVASAYLDADTAHLSGTQTVTGDKTFSGVTTLGDAALSEGKGLTILTPLLPSTDHTSTGLSAQMLDSGAGIAASQTVSISTTNTKVIVSDSNAAATMPVIGIAPAAIGTDATGTILLQGFIRDDTWGWMAGSILYASETAGAMTHTAPTTSGAFVQALGVALSADVVYFNPALTLVEVA